MRTKIVEIIFSKYAEESEIKNCIEQIRCHLAVIQVIEKDGDVK